MDIQSQTIQLTPAILGGVFILAVVGNKLLDLGVKFFWGKLTKDDYVTTRTCKELREECRRGRGDTACSMRNDIRVIKRVLWQLALSNNITKEELSKIGMDLLGEEDA